MEGFGKAKFGARGGYETYKLEEGNNIYRILPPMKQQVAKRVWNRYVAMHYGFERSNPRDPAKPKAAPFLCVRETDYKTKAVKVECPECVRIQERKDLVLKLQNSSKPEDKTRLEMTKKWLKSHNLDCKQYVLVKALDGKFGALKMPNAAFKVLRAEIDQLLQRKIDPLDIEKGVWLNIFRIGMDQNSSYSVKIVKEHIEVNGEVLEKTKFDIMSEDEAALALETCPDLSEIGRVVTPEQVRALVEGTGDPIEVDTILGVSQPNVRAELTPRSASKAAFSVEASPVAEAPAAAAPVVVVSEGPDSEETPAAADPAVDDEEAALLAQLAATRAKKAAATAKAPVLNPALKPAVVPVVAKQLPVPLPTGLPSDDEFVKMYGGK